MITLDDCAAFCDADPDEVEQLACEEHVAMPLAFAMAQASAERAAASHAITDRSPIAQLVNFPVSETRIAA